MRENFAHPVHHLPLIVPIPAIYIFHLCIFYLSHVFFSYIHSICVFLLHRQHRYLYCVADAPIVALTLGAPLDPQSLIKGSDVYLECDIKANPAVKRVEWFHNVSNAIYVFFFFCCCYFTLTYVDLNFLAQQTTYKNSYKG